MTKTLIEKQYQQTVRETILKNSELNWAYIFMNILAAAIASYGLLANSPAVVIGAMIVAMLLQPIAGISLALVDSNMRLLLRDIMTLLVGAIGVMLTAFIIGTIHKDIPITNEIMARTAPNILDLMVALAGGAAGAYATVSPRLSVAFVGVAIATALVPPLSAASILFAHGEFNLASGALLLTFTNIVAIQFAFAVVLWFSGFRRITSTSGHSVITFLQVNFISIAILLVLGFLLTNSLQRIVARHLFETTTQFTLQQQIDSYPGFYMTEVRFETDPTITIVRAVVRGPNPPSAAEVATLEKKLPAPPDGTALELRVRFVQTTIINRDGLLYNDATFGENQ